MQYHSPTVGHGMKCNEIHSKEKMQCCSLPVGHGMKCNEIARKTSGVHSLSVDHCQMRLHDKERKYSVTDFLLDMGWNTIRQ